MTALRRGVLLLALAVATVLGLTVTPAQAAFTAQVTLPTSTIGTVTVTAPTNVQANSFCTSWLSLATISWGASDARDVTGYRITAYRNGTPTVLGTTTDTSTTTLIGNGTTYSFSVTTLTSYGWTADSTKTGTIRC